jgi:hypothetical protein
LDACALPVRAAFRGALITVRLNEDVDHVAVLIHGALKILLLAVDSNEDSSKCHMSPRRP